MNNVMLYQKMKGAFKLYMILLAMLCISAMQSCQQEITVDLPTVEPSIVVEGTILNDRQPIIFLSWTQAYFAPTNTESIVASYISSDGVEASIATGGIVYPLQRICLSDLPEDLQDDVSEALGLPVSDLAEFDICAYTNFELTGVPGEEYKLTVDYMGHHLESATKIPGLVYLDTLWFDVVSSLPDDSLGFIFGNLTDPDTVGNAYRWFAQRISHYPQWVPDEYLRGQQKDARYIAPIGSVFDDEFFNGLSFEFAYYRGDEPNTGKFDDLNNERGFFKRGDTVAVRGCTIDRLAYRFISSFEDQVANQGSPFAIPANLQTNVQGGLGAFIGYGAIYDTVICY
ncbi:MAG: DUF4249 family protein [Flavobacteriales bacterium]